MHTRTRTPLLPLLQGDGTFVVNGKSLSDYFPMVSDRRIALEPLIATQACGALDVWLTVKGGGITGQAGAVKHGLANALVRYDPYLKPSLKKRESAAAAAAPLAARAPPSPLTRTRCTPPLLQWGC